MQKSLRLMIGAALVVNLVAAALTLALRPPTGPDDPGTSIYDCTLWHTFAQLLVLSAYYACILYCSRAVNEGEERAICYTNCLKVWILAEFAVLIMYLVCVISTIWT
ncbi:MAG: hypothetical protein IT532_11570 [Burkholderiales bacterium]|nr:hypothetical protein [Burkholderiales bacterium]